MFKAFKRKEIFKSYVCVCMSVCMCAYTCMCVYVLNDVISQKHFQYPEYLKRRIGNSCIFHFKIVIYSFFDHSHFCTGEL